ncbi:MAG TPA: hypothetical protein VJJ83_05140 [Candidatus Babeliales bacterium]|nr:hypothetical protein [Candidatus Babeliales bacterium]
MNLLIVLSVTTVLLVYCQLSWHNLSLNLELAIQRTMQLQHSHAVAALLQYGQYLVAQRPQPAVVAPASNNLVLYQGAWPLAPATPIYQAQLLLTFTPVVGPLPPKAKLQPRQLTASLYDQQGQLLAQQTMIFNRGTVKR